MFKKISIFILLFFVFGCSGSKKEKIKPWKSSIVHYGMSSCEKSLKHVYKVKYKENGYKWNGSKAILYCGCSLDKMREKINDDDFLFKLRNNELGREMKISGDFCKSNGINWYEEK